MRSLSPISTIALAVLFSTIMSDVSAECTMPDPPMFHAQNRIFAFETLNDVQKKEVKAFKKFPKSTSKIILKVANLTAVRRLDNNTPMGTPDKRSVNERYLNPDHPGGQPTIPQSDWKRVNCVDLKDDPLEVVKKKGCSFRMKSVGNDNEQNKVIKKFQSEVELKIKECEVLIVHSTSTPDKWTIAGFNDKGLFKTVLINDSSGDLSVELKKKRVNKKKIVELVLAKLDRTEKGTDTPSSFVTTLPYIQAPDKIRTSFVRTAQSIFPGEVDMDGDGTKETVDPYANPPGTNMLPTVFANMRNTSGGEMLNTLPSTKTEPYNLHAEEPTATQINPESPSDDLKYIMSTLYEVIADEPYEEYLIRSDGVSLQDVINDAKGASDRVIASRSLVKHHIQWALDIIEGNDERGTYVPDNRAYRGFALLNHSGHKRVKRVMPVYDASGEVTGGEVTIRQLWYGGRIQSDTMFLDFGYEKSGGKIDYVNCGGKGQPSDDSCRTGLLPIPPNKPWQVHFEIYVLNKGNDDFSPMTMQFDCPSKLLVDDKPVIVGGKENKCPGPEIKVPIGRTSWSNGPLYASMDQSFFPMADGTRVDLTLKMAPPQFFNLTYTWGWRVHPPRAQAIENGEKVIPPPLSSKPENPFEDVIQMYCHPLRASIIEHERFAFEGFTGPSKLPDEVRALPPDQLFAKVQQLAKKMGLALPKGTPGPDPENEQIEACFKQFKTAIDKHPHFVQAGMALQKICKGRRPDSDGKITPPDMMDARLCLLNVLFPEQLTSSADDPYGPYDRAIDKIADIAPAKRMWRSFRAMRAEVNKPIPPGPDEWIPRLRELRSTYIDWLNRSHLPSGVQPDPKSDLTMLYVNNTIYGQLRTGGYVEFPDWRRRGDMVKITLLNGDYFPHGYLNVDFGGARGWENLWQSTVKTAGSGPWFTFGRFHARFNTVPGSIAVGAARPLGVRNKVGAPENVELTAHRVMLEFNFEPNPRLRFYQFDPLHHDSAIYSIH